MKTKSLTLVFSFALCLFFSHSCKSQSKSYDEQILIMLTDFYTIYITESAKMPPNIKKINELKVKYCTNRLLSEMLDEELEYDPFLKAQDSNVDWLKTLSIKQDLKDDKLYIISYTDSFNESQIIIKLVVVKEKETFKIDSIQ